MAKQRISISLSETEVAWLDRWLCRSKAVSKVIQQAMSWEKEKAPGTEVRGMQMAYSPTAEAVKRMREGGRNMTDLPQIRYDPKIGEAFNYQPSNAYSNKSTTKPDS